MLCLGYEAYVADLNKPLRRGIFDVDLVVAGLAERVAQPFETLVETISARSAGGLDVLFLG
jgi:hypothetical protein